MTWRLDGLVKALVERLAPLVVAGAFAVACFSAITSLWLPFGWDHGMIAAVADAIAHGGLPYRDSWDMKGPLAFAPFALAQVLFGHVMWGIRLIEIVIVVPLIYAFHRAVSAQTTVVVGAGASVALYLWIASAGWFFTAQPDLWAALLVAAAACLVLNAETPRGAATLALVGGLIGCAGLIKPTYLGFGLAPLAYLSVLQGADWPRRARLAAWLAGGAAAPIILVVGYLALRGGLASAIEVHVLYASGPYRVLAPDVRTVILRIGQFFATGPLLVLAPFVAAGLWARRGERTLLAPLLAWLLAAIVGLFLQGRFNAHHWFVLYPPLLTCAALGVHALARDAGQASLGKVVSGVAALVFLGVVAASPAREVVRWARHVTGALPAEYYDHYEFFTYKAGDEMRAARHLAARTGPDDGVFVWGNDATARFLADRPNPTRFEFDLPLTTWGAFQGGYRGEMMADLAAAPPAYIIVGTPWHGGPKQMHLDAFPEFLTFLTSRYVLETSIGSIDLYRRADRADVEGAAS
jgi:hypothetical protein